MGVWLWVPYPLISISIPGVFATYLSVPIKRVCFKPTVLAMTVSEDSWSLAIDTLRGAKIKPTLPDEDISFAPKLVQYLLCVYASISRGVGKRVEAVLLNLVSDVLSADPGLVNSLVCTSRYGTVCIARFDEVARVRVPFEVRLHVLGRKEVKEIPSIVQDPVVKNFLSKIVSHVIMKFVNSSSIREALDYLELYGAVVRAITRISSGDIDAIPSLLPWVNEFEVMFAKVDLVEGAHR